MKTLEKNLLKPKALEIFWIGKSRIQKIDVFRINSRFVRTQKVPRVF